ncbi:SusD/RagB family nutrient-binding outer membrane lipoprotein [Membranihabitans marinus]|uniref:SusD/RagB family nutrient-binding outer membrane lipoprotein n=1 Tax=Membranihabitans marinus TaxID=1227546 RepID=UPI001F2B5040|nr:SusD/RagB family nutrient-binding outer membrane lipoprotein [Membranihabitans marinus]
MNIRYILLGSILSLSLLSCTDHFDELNTDPKNLTVDKLDQTSYPLIVANAMYAPIHLGSEANGPFQLAHSLFADVYANYFASTHPNFPSDQFTLVGRWLNGAYTWFYENAAPQIKYAEDFAIENGYDVENAIMKTWRVYAYHRITDFWGPIPYKNFGNGEKSVPYNSQEEIYDDFFTTLDAAVAILKSNAGETSFLGSKDIIYGGNVDQWLKLANSLRLRLAMRIKYADPARSKTEAEKAYQDGVIEHNIDNAFATTSTDWGNSYNVISQWGEYRMSADMESILKGYKDPRAQKYFSEASSPDPSDDPAGLTFNYEGMRNGQSKSDRQAIAFNSLASDMAGPYIEAGGAGPDWPIMRAAETYFLRAEGALEGWNMGGSAAELYEGGIAASMDENGYTDQNLLNEDYLSATSIPVSIDADNPPVSTVPTMWESSADPERQLEQIITQKWIALYPDSWEAWAERRRTSYPVLYPRLTTENELIDVNSIPRRVPYVSTEYDTNRDAVDDAIQNMLGGADNGTTKLWWDKK